MKKDSYIVIDTVNCRISFDTLEDIYLDVLGNNCDCGNKDIYDKKDNTHKCKFCFLKDNMESLDKKEMINLLYLLDTNYRFIPTTKNTLNNILDTIENYNIYASSDEIALIEMKDSKFFNGKGYYNMILTRSNGQKENFESSVFNDFDEMRLALFFLGFHFNNKDNTFYSNTKVDIDMMLYV